MNRRRLSHVVLNERAPGSDLGLRCSTFPHVDYRRHNRSRANADVTNEKMGSRRRYCRRTSRCRHVRRLRHPHPLGRATTAHLEQRGRDLATRVRRGHRRADDNGGCRRVDHHRVGRERVGDEPRRRMEDHHRVAGRLSRDRRPRRRSREQRGGRTHQRGHGHRDRGRNQDHGNGSDCRSHQADERQQPARRPSARSHPQHEDIPHSHVQVELADRPHRYPRGRRREQGEGNGRSHDPRRHQASHDRRDLSTRVRERDPHSRHSADRVGRLQDPEPHLRGGRRCARQRLDGVPHRRGRADPRHSAVGTARGYG